MSKGLYRILFSLLLACFCLAIATLSAYAAPARVKISTARALVTTSAHRWRGKRAFHQHQPWGWHPSRGGPGFPEINQYFHGNADYDHFYRIVDVHRQGNSGNVGDNRGHNLDNSTNGGNQMVLSGRSVGYRRINQHYHGNSHFNWHILRLRGYD
ncbi:MAG TPA: hypothetical protein VF458_06500, partial [Ktedonobacteraceae bacterium]